MAIKNLGNFKKTIGSYDMVLEDGAVLEFKDGFDGDELIELSEILREDGSKLKPLCVFITNSMNKNDMFDKEWKENDKSRFIVQNLNQLIKGYMVMFELTTPEAYDKIIDTAAEKAKESIDSKISPIEEVQTE